MIWNTFLSYLGMQCLAIGLNKGECLKKKIIVCKAHGYWGKASRQLTHWLLEFPTPNAEQLLPLVWDGARTSASQKLPGWCSMLQLRTTVASHPVSATQFWSKSCIYTEMCISAYFSIFHTYVYVYVQVSNRFMGMLIMKEQFQLY